MSSLKRKVHSMDSSPTRDFDQPCKRQHFSSDDKCTHKPAIHRSYYHHKLYDSNLDQLILQYFHPRTTLYPRTHPLPSYRIRDHLLPFSFREESSKIIALTGTWSPGGGLILAVSTQESLSVYQQLDQKPLWHESYFSLADPRTKLLIQENKIQRIVFHYSLASRPLIPSPHETYHDSTPQTRGLELFSRLAHLVSWCHVPQIGWTALYSLSSSSSRHTFLPSSLFLERNGNSGPRSSPSGKPLFQDVELFYSNSTKTRVKSCVFNTSLFLRPSLHQIAFDPQTQLFIFTCRELHGECQQFFTCSLNSFLDPHSKHVHLEPLNTTQHGDPVHSPPLQVYQHHALLLQTQYEYIQRTDENNHSDLDPDNDFFDISYIDPNLSSDMELKEIQDAIAYSPPKEYRQTFIKLIAHPLTNQPHFKPIPLMNFSKLIGFHPHYTTDTVPPYWICPQTAECFVAIQRRIFVISTPEMQQFFTPHGLPK